MVRRSATAPRWLVWPACRMASTIRGSRVEPPPSTSIADNRLGGAGHRCGRHRGRPHGGAFGGGSCTHLSGSCRSTHARAVDVRDPAGDCAASLHDAASLSDATSIAHADSTSR